MWCRHGFRDTLALGLICPAMLLAVHGSFALLTGFDPIRTLRATEQVYRFGIASERPSRYWVFGLAAALLLMLALPVAAWRCVRWRRRRRGDRDLCRDRDRPALAASPEAEVEWIWLFLAPFACLAAATAVDQRQLLPVHVLLAAQALA